MSNVKNLVEIALIANHLDMKQGDEFNNLNKENAALVAEPSIKSGIQFLSQHVVHPNIHNLDTCVLFFQ